jgi:glycosyltransferase involved in cell wall biosynthesis
LNAGPAGTTPPKATVLIPAYNAAKFIHRTIASACRQTEADIEILVVDDASSDDTPAVVGALALADPRLMLLRLSANGGPSVARNAGIAAARGDWIAVLDADDAFVPTHIATLLAAAADTKADIIADNFCIYDPMTGRESAPTLPTGVGLRTISLADFLRQARPYAAEVDWDLRISR